MKSYRYSFVEADRELILTALSARAHQLHAKARDFAARCLPTQADTARAMAERYDSLMLAIADGDCDLRGEP